MTALKHNTKHLILNILLAMDTDSISIQNLIAACELFGIKAAHVRVVVQRLVKDQLLESPERGRYGLGVAASRFAGEKGRWRTSLDQLVSWDGDWIGVHCAGLGRTDRLAVRDRERALQLMGFRELSKAFYIRPNNLQGGLQQLQHRLVKLGLESTAPVFRIVEMDGLSLSLVSSLWQVAQLEQGYRETTDKMKRWLEQSHQLDVTQAATESFLIGERAIRQMMYDPLLPEKMVSISDRQSFFSMLYSFDQAGHRIWRQLQHQAGWMMRR
jgi:phenylacetic acid degradation operon negative regulatory protein